MYSKSKPRGQDVLSIRPLFGF